jgi:hypothetical protein
MIIALTEPNKYRGRESAGHGSHDETKKPPEKFLISKERSEN